LEIVDIIENEFLNKFINVTKEAEESLISKSQNQKIEDVMTEWLLKKLFDKSCSFEFYC
jgi:hypothetical protein